MNSKKNKMGSSQELYRICPSKLTKHELEDLYFTVLETNIQLRKTINEQQERIKTLSNRMQRKTSAQKVLQAEEKKNCCVTTNLKVKQQKESIDELRRSHERTAERIRKLNTQVCSANQNSRFSPYCAQKTSSKWIKHTSTPSTLKNQCKSAVVDVQKEEPEQRLQPADTQIELQKNNKTSHTVGTQTELLRDERLQPADTQTELPANYNKSFDSVGSQTELLRDKILRPEDTQTELPTDERSQAADTQTELPTDERSQAADTQTELPTDERSQAADTQTELPTDERSQVADTQTELPTDERSQVADTQTELPTDDSSVNSVQTQTESAKRNVSLVSVENQNDFMSLDPYKHHEIENPEETSCDANKCRVLMDELKQKINSLMEELAKTHRQYSDRISRLEVEVQEYRKESTHVIRRHVVGGQDGSIPAESYLNQLVDNLKISAEYTAELKMQLAKEKTNVAELASQLRDAQLHNRVTEGAKRPLVNNEQEENKEPIQSDAEQCVNICVCSCDPHCWNTHCPFRNHTHITPCIYKHECTSTCCSEIYTPNNTVISMKNNASEQYTFNVKTYNDIVDSNKDQDLPETEMSQELSDKHNSQYSPNTKKNENLTNRSKRITDGNNDKEMTMPPFVDKGILDNSKRRDSSNAETLPDGNQNYNMENEKKIEALQDANTIETVPANDLKNDGNSNHNRHRDMSDLNKTHKLSDVQNIDRGDLNETQKYKFLSTNKNECNTKDLAEANVCDDVNQNKYLNTDDNIRRSQEEAYINKLNDKIDDHVSKNNLGTHKQQFQSRDRQLSVLSDSYENRDKASPSLLVKSLMEINEEQTKTVAELRRQQNNSQKSASKTERAQNNNLKSNVGNNRDTSDIPQDTIGLMRVLSILAENKSFRQQDDKGVSTDNKPPTEQSQNPLQTNLDCDFKPDSSKKRSAVNRIDIPEETMGLLRLVSTVRENIHDNITDREKTHGFHDATINSKVQVPTQKTSTEPATMNHDHSHNAQSQSSTSEKRYQYSNDNRCTFKDINQVCKEMKNTELDAKKLNELMKATKNDFVENVPTKDKIVEKYEESGSDGTICNKNERGTAMNNEKTMSWTAMNNSMQTGPYLKKRFNTIDTDTQVQICPERLEARDDFKDVNTVTAPAHRELATYRRNSGTLCFKTVPASKRSHQCQCDEQFHCEIVQKKGIQTESELKNVNKYEQATCATGHTKCTRYFAPKNMNNQMANTSTVSGAAANSPSKQSNENAFSESFDQSLTNYLHSKEEIVPINARPTYNECSLNQRNYLCRKTSTGSSKDTKETLQSVPEKLAPYKELSSQNSLLESGVQINNTLEMKGSEEVLNEFDAGCQLKRGMAKNSVNEKYSPRCVFVLHIGTVVLSDEAVLISRGKSLGLTWKFYDQDVMTTQMRASRVVVFDFSTEYDLNLTDKFLNYMKHDVLKIVICQLEEPNKPIASCELPLRDALLNTNRRADMSLALVAGPQMIYARQVNNALSDILDAGDEMGVLDLWCMLRAEAHFVPLINKTIAQHSQSTILHPEPNKSDSNSNEEQMDNTDTELSNTENKNSQRDDEFSSLHRWGSSVLRLPSREVSKESIEKCKQENITGLQAEVNLENYEHRDSGVFKTPNTVEIDQGAMPKRKTIKPRRPEKKLKTKPKKDTKQPPPTTSTAVQYNFQDDFPESMIIDEVFANIRTSEDIKRVMNRASLNIEPHEAEADSASFKKQVRSQQQLRDLCSLKQAHSQQKIKDLSSSRQISAQNQSTDMSNLTLQNNLTPDGYNKKYKKKDGESILSLSQEPTLLLPRTSLGSKRSDMVSINRKYDNIAKLYAKYNSQKNEGTRADQSKKQVTISAKRAYKTQEEEPQKDKPEEEEEQTIDITVLWLALNEECEAMLNPRVQRVYVAYEFLGRSGADLETPVSLPKPKHYVDKCYFNFKKTFQIDKDEMARLGDMARCRAASQVSKSGRDCIVFSVISEPPEDPLGLDICEDIGYAYLYLGDLIAYSAGSSGYTEVVPVRSLNGTSVCGVLAVRLDGLDVLRRCLKLVDASNPCIE